MSFLKKILTWGSLAAILYVLLSYHFIFVGKDVKLLKKSQLTLNYTFYSIPGKTNRKIISIDALRKDGIADLLVEIGRISPEQRDMFLDQYQKKTDSE
ncbi:MAG: hypothetical protein WAL98_14775 [Desulfatiglandaceae bacterium]